MFIETEGRNERNIPVIMETNSNREIPVLTGDDDPVWSDAFVTILLMKKNHSTDRHSPSEGESHIVETHPDCEIPACTG